MKISKYSIIIVGSGIAGVYSALKLEQTVNLPDGILLVTKSKLEDSNSKFAQGGMVAVLENNKNDTVELHVSDTLKAGAGLSELNAVKFISENSDKVVKDLLSFGVEFDTDDKGEFTLTKEAAHSVRRILHSGGDATGRKMEFALCDALRNNKNIKTAQDTVVVDLLVKNGSCGGVITFNVETKEYEAIYADTVIIATGGIGQLYKYTTNPLGATGDGVAICYNAGAIMQDMEFVQFHPTALAFDGGENRFLISEAVRGEGAKLCDEFGMEFMGKYHEKRELAPRDVVARSIYCEMNNNGEPFVYLNATGIGEEKLLKRFPTIAKKCLEYGIDITTDLIPVAPASHYFMGGVKTNLKGETSIKNLYAVGEVASTGLHGANRLASNSLLECVVCAYEVAQVLKNNYCQNREFEEALYEDIISKYENDIDLSPINVKDLKQKMQDIMWSGVGIFRNEKTLMSAKEVIEDLEKQFERKIKCLTKEEYEFRNMITVAKLIVNSAINRKESRGAHYRIDYLNTDDVAVHSLIEKDKGEISFVS